MRIFRLPHPLRALWLLSGLLLFAVACRANSTEAPAELRIFAAASLTDAFSELAAAFEERHPAADVTLNFAGSSQLAAQLREGARADLFASANPDQMQAVVDAGRVTREAPVPFATNRLALIVPDENPAGITALADLARPGVALILAAPGVPVRTYAESVIGQLPEATAAAIRANVVSEEENVRQVAAKVALGEADAGIVYSSDVTPDLRQHVREVEIPADQNIEAVYPVAVLADAPQAALAHDFLDFLLSSEGRAILERWGFGGPPPG